MSFAPAPAVSPLLASMTIAVVSALSAAVAAPASAQEQSRTGQPRPAAAPRAPLAEFPRRWFWHSRDAQYRKHAAMHGSPMPALDLDDWINGALDLDEDLSGQVVVIDFWATWCGPCIAGIPMNNELWREYRDRGLVLLGVCGSNRGQEKMAQVVETHGIRYPVARDVREKSATAYQVMFWPTYAVVDRAGKLRAIGLRPEHVEGVVQKLIAEKPPVESTGGVAAVPAVWLEDNPHRDKRLREITGKSAPPLAVTDWMNSNALRLEDLRGKVVMLDFWATWCGPCIRAIPHTNELAKKHRGEGLVVIGVCHPRDGEKMRATAAEHGIRYPIALDPDGATATAYGVNSWPDYYFVDRAGNLRIADCKNGRIADAIEMLLAEEVPANGPPAVNK